MHCFHVMLSSRLFLKIQQTWSPVIKVCLKLAYKFLQKAISSLKLAVLDLFQLVFLLIIIFPYNLSPHDIFLIQ